MGADLYLNSVFEPSFYHYKPLFDAWAQKRNTFNQVGNKEEAEAAQAKVEEYYEKMFAEGYFRDSYNSTNLIWLFGLSWWGDIGTELVGEDGNMYPPQAQTFLDLLTGQEAVFEQSFDDQRDEEGCGKAEKQEYFRSKYERLKVFLKEAITRNEAIVCSI